MSGAERGAGAAAELLHLREEEPEDFRRDPGADREIGSAQAEDDERGRQREERRDDAAEQDGDQRIEADR